jgi:3-oxoacyl-[acyl-carrier-protein] synthase II
LRDSGLEPADIGHVNAHGAGLPVADLAEARAIARVFGPGAVPVTSLKGYIGNLVSGSGAVELVGSLLSLREGKIPQTLNCDDLDPAMEIDVVRGGPRPTDNPVFLKISLTRHGQAAALVIRAPSPGDPAATSPDRFKDS